MTDGAGRTSRRLLATAVAVGWAAACFAERSGAAGEPALPNVVFVLCDNLGYGDVGCYGSRRHRTPHIDSLAAEGVRLTDFYAASGVCTPSRASLLTGCYPRRVGLHWTEPDGLVLRPVSPNGLHPQEVTIAEVLKQRGYATACIGKWHLGDQPEFLPTRQGFDAYFGIPYSDDMTPRPGRDWPPLPLLRNERVIEAPVDRFLLTRRFTQEAVAFIAANRHRPFFLYLAHAMPGSTPRPFASAAFRGRSANGPYGDAVEELDWSMGQLLAALRRLGLDRRTLVVWTSDNGAPRRNPPQGSNAPLSGWGYSTMEGGMRVPCLIRFPGRVPAGTVRRELAAMIDWLPTLASLAGAALPQDRTIDGRDIWPLLSGQPGARSPHEAFYYYQGARLEAVRSGRWKLRRAGPGRAARPAPALYDLADDPGETTDVARRHPDVVRRLVRVAETARRELGDGERPGRGQRPAGRASHPSRPLVFQPD